MIDERVKRGDSFKFLGLISCDPDPTFNDANLDVKATLRKGGAGKVIQALTVAKGAKRIEADQIVIPFEVSATFTETASWPVGSASFDVQVTYGAERITRRVVEISVEADNT